MSKGGKSFLILDMAVCSERMGVGGEEGVMVRLGRDRVVDFGMGGQGE